MTETNGKSSTKLDIRDIISIILNILIAVFTICGTYAMLTNDKSGTGLTASGIEDLKFFTVLSNEICGITAVLWLIFRIMGRKFPILPKLMAAAAVGLTFIIIAAFLAPMYPEMDMYEGGNFWFHLIVPITGMAEFMLLKTDEKIPFRYTVISALPALVYGICYLVNILVNGVGEWPDTNDWYGFLNWGYPIGMVIFTAVVLMDLGMAVLLRALNSLVSGLMLGRNYKDHKPSQR